jgi:hypothetical protein
VGDVFAVKLEPTGSNFVYSTYLGGSSIDGASGIGVDILGNAYVVGTSASTDFPTVNPLFDDMNGSDAIVAKLSSRGDVLLYSTYLGGGYTDSGYGIAVDRWGAVHIVGSTDSRDIPVVNPIQAEYGGGFYDAFVLRIDASPVWQRHLPLVAR